MTSALSDLALAFMKGHPAAAGAVLEQLEPDEAAQALLPLELSRSSDVRMRMSQESRQSARGSRHRSSTGSMQWRHLISTGSCLPMGGSCPERS